MLSREENELLTRVGAATPMGRTMRRYWIPALLSREIEPDGPPVRVRLLGENLVAFRDSRGHIGLLDEYCPHRRASLFFGRNEECGLRCVYHGWKFDVDGSCIEQMNEPESFAHKVRVTAYPTCELGGLVWAYMGPAEKIPPLPKFAWTQAPESHRHVSKVVQECNWLQGLEGGLDTSHAPILHRLLRDNAAGGGGIKPSNPYVRAGAPRLVVDITDYGYQYTGLRQLGDAEQHVRTYHYILPFHQIRAASNEIGDWGDAGHAWVPIDDETTMVYNWVYSRKEALSEEERLERAIGNGPAHVDQTNFRSKANRANNYLIDRAVQKTDTFTGINGINVQDRAIQESMGPISDRTGEHLGPADKGIIQMRRLLREAVHTAEANGRPPGLDPSYYDLYCALQVLPRDVDWRAILAPDLGHEKILQTV
jgi:phthalate 4,5-dioxygenase oxygenase subunit